MLMIQIVAAAGQKNTSSLDRRASIIQLGTIEKTANDAEKSGRATAIF